MPLTKTKTVKINKSFDRSIGRTVRELREERGWSQQMLAQKTRIDFTKLSRIENGERRLSLREAVDLAKAFGVTMTQFTGS